MRRGQPRRAIRQEAGVTGEGRGRGHLECQRPSPTRQGLHDHLGGNLRVLLKELTHAMEVLWRMQTHHFFRFDSDALERCGGATAIVTTILWLLRTNRADRCKHGRSGRDSIVDDD
jgi:hypothetical protein